jgi:signal peptidase I
VNETTTPEEAAPVTGDERDDAVPRAKRLHHHLIEWIVLIVLALVLAIGLRTYGFQTFSIPSGSMEPTLQIGDRIIVDKLAVDWGTIHRGDILVFRSPPREDCAGTHDPILVKRVIGLPGDVLYSMDNAIYVNGKKLDEAWTHTEPLGTPGVASKSHPVVVAAHNYYMLGDNHSNSCDSRYWGSITHSAIIGKVFMRVWPLRRLAYF